MELTLSQINQLKQKGWDDNKIASVAKSKGFTLPSTTTQPAQTLTIDQVNQLKNKGWDDTKIVSVAQSKGFALPKKEGFFTTAARDLSRTVAQPFVRMYQAGKALSGATEEEQKVTLPFLGTFDTVRNTGDVVKDIGKAAEFVSLGVGVGGAARTVGTGLKGAVVSGLKTGAKEGAQAGALMGFGQSLQDSEVQPSDIAYKTLFGAATGGLLGSAIGSITPVVVKGVNYTKRFTDLNQVNTELNKLNIEVFKPTTKQLEKWSTQGKNPIKTYTEIFGTETPKVGRDNRFTQESINDMVERVNDVYKPAAEGFNTILRNSPEVNSLAKAEKDAIAGLKKYYSLTPEQMIKAENKIKTEFAAIRREANLGGRLLGNDNIPVSYTDNLKDRFWSQTRNFGTEEASISNAVNSSIGHGFKDAIENSIKDVNVKNYNKQLGDLIVLRDFLETKAGALAGTGGKATRLITRLAGTVAGSQGGFAGSVLGNITGDKLAQILINPEMQPYRWLINKKLAQLPKAEVLKLEQEANNVLNQMFQKRMQTLALPAPTNKGIPSVLEMRGATTFEKPAQQIGEGYQPLSRSLNNEPTINATNNPSNPISNSISQELKPIQLETKRFGLIDFPVGEEKLTKSTGFGQLKLKDRNIDNEKLTKLIEDLPITFESENRIVLENKTHKVILSKDWNGKPTNLWVLTAYERTK